MRSRVADRRRARSPRRSAGCRRAVALAPDATSSIEVELPPETSSCLPSCRPASAASAASSPRFSLARHDRAVAGQTRPEPDHLGAVQRAGALRGRPAAPPGIIPSRRSPRSTIATMACRFPRGTRRRVQRLDVVDLALERHVREPHGPRQRERAPAHAATRTAPSIPASRIRSMFSSLDSPIAETPPASIARATSGVPQATFVTPTTSTPGNAATTRARCLRSWPGRP